jgi:hypothetical protein
MNPILAALLRTERFQSLPDDGIDQTSRDRLVDYHEGVGTAKDGEYSYCVEYTN